MNEKVCSFPTKQIEKSDPIMSLIILFIVYLLSRSCAKRYLNPHMGFHQHSIISMCWIGIQQRVDFDLYGYSTKYISEFWLNWSSAY